MNRLQLQQAGLTLRSINNCNAFRLKFYVWTDVTRCELLADTPAAVTVPDDSM